MIKNNLLNCITGLYYLVFCFTGPKPAILAPVLIFSRSLYKIGNLNTIQHYYCG